MELDDFKNITTILMSFAALILSGIVFFKHKDRYLQQKAYEWAINKVMDYLELTEKSWRQSTKVQPYISYLAIREKNGYEWSINEEIENSPDQMKNYDELKGMLMDLFYFFNNRSNPLVSQAINEVEMTKCFKLLDKYQPFTIKTFVDLEKDKKFQNLHNDLLSIQSIVNNALARKIK
ncbi:MAG: hypothetical protein ACWGHH_07175 [Sulfurovaceae bacterium]